VKPNLLSDIALFIAVVKARSFTRAAEALEMPASTLSRRIANLEGMIGFKLLNRTTRRVEPTAEGQAYFDRCSALIEEAGHAHEELSESIHAPSGMLRIAATPDFAVLYLGPLVERLAAKWPSLRFELSLSSRVEDLIGHALDVAIRLGPVRDTSLVVRKVGELAQGLYAAPALAAAGPPLDKPEDLAARDCIRLTATDAGSNWVFSSMSSAGEDIRGVTVTGRMVAGGQQMACRFACAGMGIGLLDRRVAAAALAEGSLLEIMPEWRPSPVPVNVLTTSKLLPGRVRLLITALREHLAAAA
jgi:DNA-binding transcriptional LysR family regulator